MASGSILRMIHDIFKDILQYFWRWHDNIFYVYLLHNHQHIYPTGESWRWACSLTTSLALNLLGSKIMIILWGIEWVVTQYNNEGKAGKSWPRQCFTGSGQCFLFSVMIFLLRTWPGLVAMGVWWVSASERKQFVKLSHDLHNQKSGWGVEKHRNRDWVHNQI